MHEDPSSPLLPWPSPHMYSLHTPTHSLEEIGNIHHPPPSADNKDMGKETLLNQTDLIYSLGKIFLDKGDYRTSQQYFSLAYEGHRSGENWIRIFKIISFLIRLSVEQKKDEEKNHWMKEFKQALKTKEQTDRNIDNLAQQADTEFFRGTYLSYQGLYPNAAECFHRSISLAKQDKNQSILSNALYACALNDYRLKKYLSSLSILERLCLLYDTETYRDTWGKKNYYVMAAHLLYAKIYAENGQFDRSLYFYKSAIQEGRKRCSWHMLPHAIMGMGKVYTKTGEFSKALMYFEMAQNTVNADMTPTLYASIERSIEGLQDQQVDLYIDMDQRKVFERSLGTINLNHRFILMEILYLFVQNQGVFFSKEDLSKIIWKESYNPLIHDKLIYTSISRLRKLLSSASRKLLSSASGESKYIVREKDGYGLAPSVKVRFISSEDSDIEVLGWSSL